VRAILLSFAFKRMHAHEQEIRELATRSPFVPFTVITASGERYAVRHHDFILFMPTIDETTLEPLPEEERPAYFIVAGKGSRQRWVYWDSVTAIDLSAKENGDTNQPKRSPGSSE
jgi:hypothetical protein